MKHLISAVEKNADLIYETENYIWKNPETGYKEFKTHAFMAEKFRALGYDLVEAEGITGFYTVLDTGKEGPTVLVLGEMDSIICPSHPESDPVTGAAHSCGHHAQCAALVGVAAALKEEGALCGLCGKIKLCAVPAEELLEINYRSDLMKQGKIKYFGGKPEFLSRGYFDDVDIAFMIHTGGGENFSTTQGSVGCLAKRIIYKGVAAHAGACPWDGKNALYAATCGINAVNAIRETFPEWDVIRFHPIITEGGQMVNAIPETVSMESYVRGKSFEGIAKANKRVNKALTGAALSIGTNIEIIDMPGYAPHINDQNMIQLTADAAKDAIPHRQFVIGNGYSSGSTDMGDLSCVMPIIHPYSCGSIGKGHGNDYYIKDHEGATVDSAKLQVGMLYLLLKDNAERANKIIAEFKPRFASKKEFLDYLDSLFKDGDRIIYNEDDTVTVKL